MLGRGDIRIIIIILISIIITIIIIISSSSSSIIIDIVSVSSISMHSTSLVLEHLRRRGRDYGSIPKMWFYRCLKVWPRTK